jgi:hypothetical protein
VHFFSEVTLEEVVPNGNNWCIPGNAGYNFISWSLSLEFSTAEFEEVVHRSTSQHIFSIQMNSLQRLLYILKQFPPGANFRILNTTHRRCEHYEPYKQATLLFIMQN